VRPVTSPRAALTGITASESERHLAGIAAFFDDFSAEEPRWRRRNATYHRLIESIHRFHIPEGASIFEIGSGSGDLLAALRPRRGVGVDLSARMVDLARARHPELEFEVGAGEDVAREDERFDYIVLSDLVPFAYDLLAVFQNARAMSHDRTRLVLHSYSQLWRPVITLAESLRLKRRKPIHNWVTSEDVANLLHLAGFEVISTWRRVLLPKKVPLISSFLNGVVANLWPLSHLCLTYWVVARPVPVESLADCSVSVVVPCRNEAGNIASIIERIPEMGTATEIVFVEGGSRDGTREEIKHQIELHPARRTSLHVQGGSGKADAVRLGFAHATGDLLMILDGDISVEPEDLAKFYDAYISGRAEFVNGSRLVYELEPEAMLFLNIVGNKFFSAAFSAFIGQHVKDSLCGTKVLARSDYERIAGARSYFGDFDPFGDFDLLLGAARLGLRIVDLPVRYRARTYGATNISRFRHGLLLMRMAGAAFMKMRVAPVVRRSVT
jgi:SAM-dependent methyltransferase/GT2 family glycosyltransferase